MIFAGYRNYSFYLLSKLKSKICWRGIFGLICENVYRIFDKILTDHDSSLLLTNSWGIKIDQQKKTIFLIAFTMNFIATSKCQICTQINSLVHVTIFIAKAKEEEIERKRQKWHRITLQQYTYLRQLLAHFHFWHQPKVFPPHETYWTHRSMFVRMRYLCITSSALPKYFNTVYRFTFT